MDRPMKLTHYTFVAVIALVTALIIVGTSQAAGIDARTEPASPTAALTNANDAAPGGCESVAATFGDDIYSTKSPFAVTTAPSLSNQPAPASDCYVLWRCAYELREGIWVFVCRIVATNCP